MKVVATTAGLLFFVAAGLYLISEVLRDIDERISGAFYE